jgi:hypothetical protein
MPGVSMSGQVEPFKTLRQIVVDSAHFPHRADPSSDQHIKIP